MTAEDRQVIMQLIRTFEYWNPPLLDAYYRVDLNKFEAMFDAIMAKQIKDKEND